MEGIFFLVAVVGVLTVIHWMVTNDAAGNHGPTKGFFALRKPQEKPADKKREQRR